MSDEKQETMADIVREMRNLGKLDEKSTDKIPRSLMALGLRMYADRIEAAWRRAFAELPLDRKLMNHWRDEVVKAWHTEPLLPSKEGGEEWKARKRCAN